MSILETLKKLVDDQLESEGITPHILEAVDLSVAYSPVIPYPTDGMHPEVALQHAVEVRPWGFCRDDEVPKKFDVDGRVVSPDELKVMRARYLLRRGEHYAPQMERFLKGE